MAVQGLGELVTGRRHFQTFIENSPWPLQLNVVGPFDKAGEVPFELDVLSNAKILRPFLKQGIYHLLGLLLHNSRGRCHFLPLAFISFSILGGRKRDKEKGIVGIMDLKSLFLKT